MAISEQIGVHLPYLRRYARALSGSQASGDAYVRALLQAALADEELATEIGKGKVELFAAFTRIWSSIHESDEIEAQAGLHEQAAQSRLAAISPVSRQALLLTTLEDFSIGETGRILDIPAAEAEQLVAAAMQEIEEESATDVLIIEDQPLISMQLERVVSDLGHRVTGTAATHSQAVELFTEQPAGLVLADIQLADGSSGIDAVQELLEFGDVPVIFITAYPEKLLTGERPEPTYLITKPFQESAVRAAISQALFFGSSSPIQ